MDENEMTIEELIEMIVGSVQAYEEYANLLLEVAVKDTTGYCAVTKHLLQRNIRARQE